MKTNTKDLLQIVAMYIVMAISGWFTWLYYPSDSEIIRFLIADVVMTIVCFIFSLLKKNSSVYDAYWSVIPFYFVLQWMYLYVDILTFWHYLAFAVVSIWSWRLTLNWVRSWSDFSHEDWRYVDLARKTGKAYPLVNFFGIHLYPTMMVFAGMLPLFFIFDTAIQSPILCMIGAAISLFGTSLEFFADNQLAAFKNRANPQKTDLLNTGLWGVIRNPNYLGEMLFWVGLFVIGMAYGAPLYTIIGAVVMIVLFVFISIPMKEKRMAASRPAFADYKKKVAKLIPYIF